MFGNNLDFDLDENISSDDFPPSNDKIPVNRIGAPNLTPDLFKQPLTPSRTQRVLSTMRGPHRNDEKRVVQRKFPGPAGLLPEIRCDALNSTDLNKSNVDNGDIDNMLMCSQTSLSVFQENPWTTMHSDFKTESNYTIERIKSNATSKTLVNQKAPFLAAVIKSIEYTRLKMPTLTLKDPTVTDEIQADISHELYEEHVNDLTVGSVIVLRQFSVFSVKNETVHHLTITSNNLVAIYNKERRRRFDFENRKLGCDSPSSSKSPDVNRHERPNGSCFLELDALRNFTATACGGEKKKVNACADGNERFGGVANKQGACDLVKIPSNKDSESKKNSRGGLTCKPNDLDEVDLNLSLELFSQEVFAKSMEAFSPVKRVGVEQPMKTEDSSLKTSKGAHEIKSPKSKFVVDEVGPPLKRAKTTLSQKFGEFKFRPRDDTARQEDREDKKRNFIDCSQISAVSQKEEDRDILQDVFHNVDVESLFEDF